MTEKRSPAFDRGQHRRNGNSAELLLDQGKHEQASSLLRQNLAMSSKYFSEHDLTVLSDRDTLSDCLRELGDYKGAIKLDEVTLPIRQRIDKEGEDTIATLQSLADNLREIGKHGKAVPLYRSALATRIKTLGWNHEGTLETKHNLASSLHELGQAEEASKLNAQILKAREGHLAADDENLIATRHNLATNHHALGTLEQAAQLTIQNLVVLQNTRTSDDAQLLAIREFQDRIKSTIREAKRARAIQVKNRVQSTTRQEPESVSGNQVDSKPQASEFHAALDTLPRKKQATPSPRVGTAEGNGMEPDLSPKAKKVNFESEIPDAGSVLGVGPTKRDAKNSLTKPESRTLEHRSDSNVEILGRAMDTLKLEPEVKKAGAGESRKDAETCQTVPGGISKPRGIPKPFSGSPAETEKMAKNAQQSQGGVVPFRGRSFSAPKCEVDRPQVLHTASGRKESTTSYTLPASSTLNARTHVRARSSHEQIASRLESTTLSPPTIGKSRSRSVGARSEEQNTMQPQSQAFSNTCDARDGELFNHTSGKSRSSWFDSFQQTQSLVAESRKAKGPRVKIAILDTGIDLSHRHFDSSPKALGAVDPQQYGPRRHRIKECESFVGEAAADRDSVGHGTHCADLLLELSPNADIYVARVYEGGTADNLDPEVVAKAIRHAADQWKVAIITMSFGWPQYQAAVANAIDHATRCNVLICAAASNMGANHGIAFPARFSPVICIHSTDEHGKPSRFTPSCHPGMPNFAVVGENVVAAWPGRENGHSQSGTSTATPIAAAVMALILEFVDQKPRKTPDEKRLRDHRFMAKVLLAMSTQVEGYHYVRPWAIMSTDVARGRVESRIQDAIAL